MKRLLEILYLIKKELIMEKILLYEYLNFRAMNILRVINFIFTEYAG